MKIRRRGKKKLHGRAEGQRRSAPHSKTIFPQHQGTSFTPHWNYQQLQRSSRNYAMFLPLRLSKKILTLICCCLLVGCQSPDLADGTTARVQRVVSGQTLDVILTANQPEITRVRLKGINAPDLRQQPWGAAAKSKLAELVGGRKSQQLVRLKLEEREPDKYGRRWAYVWKNGVLVNERLVEEGYALAVEQQPKHPYHQSLAHAQAYARIMGDGIWNPKQPMRLSPQAFRHRN